VSCTSSSGCTAVGPYTLSDYADANAGSTIAFALRWNGTGWSPESGANAPGATNFNQGGSLSDVDCISSRSCIAVGSFTFNWSAGNLTQVTLVERWDGGRWAVEPTPPLGLESNTGDALNNLNSVSCPSGHFCMAVGTDTPDGTTQDALAELWNGSRWVLEPTPNHRGHGNYVGTQLQAVSCGSATACTAVGFFEDRHGNDYPVAEHWNGAGWTSQPMPSRSEGLLNAISCPSATTCIAVGAVSRDGRNTFHPFAERWNRTAWKILGITGPAQPRSELGPGPPPVLTGLSCTSISYCIAVGLSGAELWNGTRWTLRVPTAGTSLTGVSCTSSPDCFAIGQDKVGSVAERWTGSKWVTASTPVRTRSSLYALSCTSPTACTAVGSPYDDPSSELEQPLAVERYSEQS
jgi:hypothetical protein